MKTTLIIAVIGIVGFFGVQAYVGATKPAAAVEIHAAAAPVLAVANTKLQAERSEVCSMVARDLRSDDFTAAQKKDLRAIAKRNDCK